MSEISPPQSLLMLDADLGGLLTPERFSSAERDLLARVASLELGPWEPRRLCGAGAGNVGLLVLSGVVARELCVHETPSAELFGAGDIIRTGCAEAPHELLRASVRWVALSHASLALVDRYSSAALRQYPEVMAIVLDRLNARAERLALTQAISQITGVETRVEAMLWHLAGRWGRVGRDGVIVPLALSHRMLGALVGARRPTVTTALARLADERRVARRADGGWLLTGDEPPAHLVPNDDPFSGEPTRFALAIRDIDRSVAA